MPPGRHERPLKAERLFAAGSVRPLSRAPVGRWRWRWIVVAGAALAAAVVAYELFGGARQ